MAILEPCPVTTHTLPLASAPPSPHSLWRELRLTASKSTHTEARICTSSSLSPLVTLPAMPDTGTERDGSESDRTRRIAEAAHSHTVWGK
ncbi:hypothetical protein BLNAU_21706 [Blattamonas nauphoetae]|uniref:Uncharacterized protein n=1 Tax=Blattamonas nauphoetae TaxID=2049346 RepID=A0ABQ9WLP5_9EUKA|nr:hypothetical protein BLNAU_24697 [Blattamonas nauphoetae]KAK2943396.1 hypothetical protein BLNAU_21706 [Blattamonas nauphoetae]